MTDIATATRAYLSGRLSWQEYRAIERQAETRMTNPTDRIKYAHDFDPDYEGGPCPGSGTRPITAEDEVRWSRPPMTWQRMLFGMFTYREGRILMAVAIVIGLLIGAIGALVA